MKGCIDKSICLECGKKLRSEKGLGAHLKYNHDISYEEYLVKYVYEGVHPTCKCGCRQNVKLRVGGKFFEYASISCSKKGKRLSTDTKRKMSASQKKRCEDPEWREKLREIGKIRPIDTSAYSEANKRRWEDRDFRTKMCEKMSEIASSYERDDEYRKKLSIGQKRRFSDPEERRRYSKIFSRDGNPNWNSDRIEQDERSAFIEACRNSLKRAKKLVINDVLDFHLWDLGYSVGELKEHIESQFECDMTWDNWGSVWHIDHIYPVSKWSVDSKISEVNALSNLRPLYAFDNLSKGSRILV